MMKNTLLTVAVLGLFAAPAVAGKHVVAPRMKLPVATAVAAKPVVVAPVAAPVAPVADGIVETVIDTNLAFGEGYGSTVLDRSHDKVEAKQTEHTLKLTVNSTVNAITPTRLADVEYCWDRMPAARRSTDTTATIKLAIEPIGSVTTTTITGDNLHAELKKCIVGAAARWRFPVADAGTEVEYAVSLHSVTLNR